MKIFYVTLLILSAFVIPIPRVQAQTPVNGETLTDDYEEDELVTEEEAIEDMKARLRKAQETSVQVQVPASEPADSALTPDQKTGLETGITVPAANPTPAPAVSLEKKAKYTKDKHDWSFKNKKSSNPDKNEPEPHPISPGMKKY